MGAKQVVETKPISDGKEPLLSRSPGGGSARGGAPRTGQVLVAKGDHRMGARRVVVACASVSVGLAIFTLVGLGRISWQEGLAGCALLVAPGLSAIRRKPRKRGTLPLTPIAVLALGTIGSVLGCSSPTAARARNALDVAAYTASLEACKDEGVRERSYARYEACAERADRTFGRRGGAR